MDIYIKPAKKVSVIGREHILVGDICETIAPEGLAERVNGIKLQKTGDFKKKMYLISALDVIEAIGKSLPECTVNNVGEIDTIVEYHSQKKTDNALWKWTKVIFISIVFMVGASSAIMSFHNDAQIPQLFKNYHKIIFGEEKENPRIIQIPYSIGLALGIIVFFNHFGGKKISDDISPIEIEMSTYDADVTATMVDYLSARKERSNGAEGRK